MHLSDMSRTRKKVKVDFRAYSAASQSLLDSVEKVQDDANVFRVTVTDVWGNGSNLFKLLDKCDEGQNFLNAYPPWNQLHVTNKTYHGV